MLRFNTLGRLYVTRDDVRLAGAAAQPRRLALLAILGAAGDRGVSRERLISLLWPDTTEERARKGLNQALYALRQDLGTDEAIAGARDLRLESAIVICDVARFRSAIARGELERAIDEYAGPFLDGFHLAGAPEFERWLETERAVLARDHATALERLARRADDGGDPTTAVEWLRRLAAHDPLDARTAVRLMEALVHADQPSAALQHARVYELLVQQELDVPPDAKVVALAARIRQELAAVAAAPVATPVIMPATVAPPAVHDAAVAARVAPPVLEPPVAVVETAPVPAPPVDAPPIDPTPTAALPIVPPIPQSIRPSSPWRRRSAIGVGAAAALAAAIAIGSQLRGRDVAPATLRLGSTHRLTLDPGLEVDAAPSPDGRVVAYAAGPEGTMHLYVRQVDGGRAVPITTELTGDQRRPRWSPDGSRLLFQAGGAIWLVASLGGVARPVVEAPASGRALYATWAPDGKTIAWVQGDTILRRLLAGGATQRVAVVHDTHSLVWSPDGRWIAAVSGNPEFLYGAVRMLPGQTSIGNAAPSALVLLPAAGGEAIRLTEGEHLHTSPEWRDARELLFVSDRDGSRDIFTLAIDASGHPAGAPQRLTTGLGPLSVGVSADGRTLTYVSFTQRANVWSVPIPTRGVVGTAGARPVTTGSEIVEGFDVSPDDRWLAFDAERSGRQQIFRVPTDCAAATDCGEPERIVEADESSFRPVWTPDGRSVVFYTFEKGVRHAFTASAQGGTPRPLLPAAWGEAHSPVIAPDGRRLTFHRDLASGSQLFETDRVGDSTWSTPRQLTYRSGWGGRWSPDGARLVYLANGQVRAMGAHGEDDSRLLYQADRTRPVPVWLRWAPDSRTLYMKAFDAQGVATIWALPAGCVPVSDAGCGAPRLLLRFDEPQRPARRPEFASDGRRFYFTLAERESDLWMVRLPAPN